MTRHEYEQKKAECWEEFTTMPLHKAFNYAFDRAYALGQQTETVTQEDIEKAAEAFATPPVGNGGMFTREQVKGLLVKFAQLFPGKQEKDADTVISGWVCRDTDDLLRLHYSKPERTDGGYWQGGYKSTYFPKGLFPDLTWDNSPEEVEIIIKRKKNG